MDLGCFVRVLPGDAPGGTGYLISRDRVLTAAHVVGEAERVSIEQDAAEGEDVVRLEATVHWRGDEACDVALLLLDEPVAIDVTLPRLGVARLGARRRRRASRPRFDGRPSRSGLVVPSRSEAVPAHR